MPIIQKSKKATLLLLVLLILSLVPAFSYGISSFNVSLGTNTDFQNRDWNTIGLDLRFCSVTPDFTNIEKLHAGFGFYGGLLAHFPKNINSTDWPEGVFPIEFVCGVYPALYYYLTGLQYVRVELGADLRLGLEPDGGGLAFGLNLSAFYTNKVTNKPINFGFSLSRISNGLMDYTSWTGYSFSLLFGLGTN